MVANLKNLKKKIFQEERKVVESVRDSLANYVAQSIRAMAIWAISN